MTTLPTLTSFRPAPSLSDMVTLKKRLTDSLEDIANFVPQMQSVISAQNANNAEMQVLNDQVAQNAQNAQDAATTATQMAERAEAVVIPTGATYNLTQLDTRNTMMSKAAFNALAAERRANRAGSGFDEMGKHYAGFPNVNEGMWTGANYVNLFKLGASFSLSSVSAISKTEAPIVSVNGIIHTIGGVNVSNNIYTYLNMPTAPTVLPYSATLTTEQIAMGAIKHADSSNSGLIVNGKFTTDSNGWSAYEGGTLSISSGRLRLTDDSSINARCTQAITCVVGKKYIIEAEVYKGTSTSAFIGVSTLANGASAFAFTTYTVDGRYTLEFTATATTHYIGLYNGVGNTNYVEFDNIAVFPSDAISRSDLVFLETWHEDVSEKDFVYPLGNVQYLGGVTDGMGAIVSGAFGGSGTYSLFGVWQASGALIGKGYVWSTMTDAQKKAFVSNPENNCYLDGATIVQVRYRIRVVAGMGDSWANVNTQATNITPTFGALTYVSTNFGTPVPKGKNVAVTSDFGTYSSTGCFGSPLDTSIVGGNIGAWKATGVNGPNGFLGAYEGLCFALPIAIIHRRNQGGYNATYNPHGTRTMTMSPTSIADCFNSANYNASTGYIGTSTSRPDGLFYDQISVEDFKPSNKGADLRNSSRKRTAQNLIEEFAPKVIAGTLLYNNNDTTALTTYKDYMEVRDTSGNRYPMKNKVGNVVTINDTVANKKGFSIVTQNGKQYLQVADDAASDTTVQMNLSVTKYDLGVFDA